MAGDKVLSGNLRLRLNQKTIFDATGCSLSLQRDTKQRAATKDTPAGATTKSTRTWSASFNGLAVYAGDGNDGHNFEDLFDLWKDDTEDLVEVQFVPSNTDYTFYYQGEGILTALDGTFNVDEDGTISLTVSGSGDISKIDKGTTDPDA